MKNFSLKLVAFGGSLALMQTAFAWDHLSSSFKLVNNTGYDIVVTKTHSYQMNTNDDSSANQTIAKSSNGKINFWGQWKANNADYDDGMDFSISANGAIIGYFTINVTNNTWGLTYGIKKNTTNVVLKSNASDTLHGIKFRSTEGEIDIN